MEINKCDFFILLWILYAMKDKLYLDGIMGTLLLVTMIVWGCIETIKVMLVKKQHSIIRSSFFLVIMYCIYGGWSVLWGNDAVSFGLKVGLKDYTYLLTSLYSLLPIFLFYDYTKKRLLTENRIMIYTLIFICIAIVKFYEYRFNIIFTRGDEEMTNNVGYTFAGLIPLILFFDKKIMVQYFLLIILGLFIIMGMKRGAILVGGVSSFIFLYSNYKIKSKKTVVILFSFVVILMAIYYVNEMMQNSAYFMRRFEQTVDGNTSGRDYLYNTLWLTYMEKYSLIDLLFGRGADTTLLIAGNYAHQDWLETLINNGLLGFFVLLYFFITLFSTVYRIRQRFPPYLYYSFIMLVFILFSKSIFSMSIQNLDISQSMLIGYFAYWSGQIYK